MGFGAHYGGRLNSLFLFGSQSRGDATDESDVDVLVLLNGKVDALREIDDTLSFVTDVSLKYGTVVSCVFVSSEAYENDSNELLAGLKSEGRRF